MTISATLTRRTYSCLGCQKNIRPRRDGQPRIYCIWCLPIANSRAGRSDRYQCSSCKTDIRRMKDGSIYCLPCRQKVNATPRQGQKRVAISMHEANAKASKAVGKRSSRSRTPDSSVAQRPTNKQTKDWPPNWEGDFWEGWNGPYSPNLTPLEIELIEKHFGSFDPKMVRVKQNTPMEDS